MPRVSSKDGPSPAVVPFVGRSSELESVKAYLAEAKSVHPRLVLITGDAGMGKTRLLRELRSAADPNAVVLYGHCYEDVSIPYLPFVEVVRSLLDRRPQALALLAPAEAATIGRLLGKGGEPPAVDQPSKMAEQDQMRLFLAVARLLLESALGFPRPSQQLVTTLLHATGGNPLFIQEAMHHLATTGGIAERGGYLVPTAPGSHLKLPSQVTDAIALRVQALSDTQRRTLTLAALLGERFDFSTLLEVAQLSEEELVDALEACVEQRFLIGVGDGFRFTHPLVQRVLYGMTSVRRRQRLHHQIAEALERLYSDSIGEHVAEIAHHLMNSGPTADVERVVEFARRAGDHARGIFAWGDAARYYEAALSAARSGERFSAHDLEELHYMAGRAYRYDHDAGPALEHFERAIPGFRETGDFPSLARALAEKVRIRFSLAAVPFGVLTDVQTLEEVLGALGPEDREARARVLETMSTAFLHARQGDRAEQLAQQALAVAKETGNDEIYAQVGTTLSLSAMTALRLEQALQYQDESIEFALRSGVPDAACWPMVRKCGVLISLGRLGDAERSVREACDLTRRV